MCLACTYQVGRLGSNLLLVTTRTCFSNSVLGVCGCERNLTAQRRQLPTTIAAFATAWSIAQLRVSGDGRPRTISGFQSGVATLVWVFPIFLRSRELLMKMFIIISRWPWIDLVGLSNPRPVVLNLFHICYPFIKQYCPIDPQYTQWCSFI